MTKKLEVGDIVLCQFYNVPDKRFYGDKFKAVIIEIGKTNYHPERDLTVKWICPGEFGDGHISTLWRKEIIRRIK